MLAKLALSPLAPYLLAGSMVVLAGGGWLLWHKGSLHGQTKGKAAVAEQIEKQYHDELVATKAEAKLSRELNSDLISRLARVPSSAPVKEAVSAHPTHCPLAPAVTHSLRQQATDSNAARTSGKRRSGVPPAR